MVAKKLIHKYLRLHLILFYLLSLVYQMIAPRLLVVLSSSIKHCEETMYALGYSV